MAATSERLSNNPNMLSRLRNAPVIAFNKSKVLPKMVVVIIEDDLISYFDKIYNDIEEPMTEKDITKLYTHSVKWVMSEFRKIFETIKEDILPSKAKRNDWPHFLWILPTTHKNYFNNWKREVFTQVIKRAARLQSNVFALELKQLWDFDDSSLFLYPERRYSPSGLTTLWSSLDRTIRFCNSIINKNEFNAQKERYEQQQSNRTANHTASNRISAGHEGHHEQRSNFRPIDSFRRRYSNKYKVDRRWKKLPPPP